MIISPVRSNNSSDIGFLGDFRRLNVSITRQKFGLIVVGNASFLSKIDNFWLNFISSFADNNLLGCSYEEIYNLQKQNKENEESSNAFI